MPTSTKKRDTHALKAAFVAYLIDGDPNKGTQKQWAKDHGLDAATLSDWKQDELVLDLLNRWDRMLAPAWAVAVASLTRITADTDHPQCVAAIRELGKLLKKYPNEKVDLTLTDRVAYVPQGALRELSTAIEARPN